MVVMVIWLIVAVVNLVNFLGCFDYIFRNIIVDQRIPQSILA